MKESYFERLLKINTIKSETRMDKIRYYNRYEGTPYEALEELFKHYTPSDKDHFVDFGSGKGRFSFFVNYFFNSSSTGVEIVEEFYKDSLKNLDSYSRKNQVKAKRIFFVNSSAEKYSISKYENKFYFFNPFSVNIFISVVNSIIKSIEEENRTVDIILYYPSDEYINFLERKTMFTHVMDIPIGDIDSDFRDRFSIYRLGDIDNVLIKISCFKSCKYTEF